MHGAGNLKFWVEIEMTELIFLRHKITLDCDNWQLNIDRGDACHHRQNRSRTSGPGAIFRQELGEAMPIFTADWSWRSVQKFT